MREQTKYYQPYMDTRWAAASQINQLRNPLGSQAMGITERAERWPEK